LESTSLPTDSLYKMLTIGGLVLVIGAFAIGWKAADETQLVMISTAEAESAFANANTPVHLQCWKIINEYQKIESQMVRAINPNGVNWEALKEFKGGQPNDFPSLVDTLRSQIVGGGINFDAKPSPIIPKNTGVEEWLQIVSKIREHRKSVESFLTAPNLTVISKELQGSGLKQVTEIEKFVDQLELTSLSVAAPERSYESAKRRTQWANTKQKVAMSTAIVIFLIGIFVFARASKNWYEQAQRYHDAILQAEAHGKKIGTSIILYREGLWVVLPATIGLLLYLIVWSFGG